MNAITISDGATTITMPVTKKVSDAGELVYKEKTMAGGRRVRTITGFRPGFAYVYDHIPADTISALITMLRTGGFFTVDYFDLDYTDKSGVFSIDYPLLSVFGYKNGVAVWHDCTLTIKAQGVI